MKTIIKTLFICTVAISLASCKTSNTVGNEIIKAQIEKQVTKKDFSTTYNMAIPLGGKSIHLSGSSYFLDLSNDSLKVYLPYFGRAYSAPYDTRGGGFDFVSTKFEYDSTRKKSGWNIKIETKDTNPHTRFYMDIMDNGKIILSASDNNRQSITFYGQISLSDNQ